MGVIRWQARKSGSTGLVFLGPLPALSFRRDGPLPFNWTGLLLARCSRQVADVPLAVSRGS